MASDPYATIDDVTRRYNPILGFLGTDPEQIASVDISSVYIADAMSIVNAYLSRRYVIPLTPEPILTDITSDIAIYRALADRAPRIPEFMSSRYTYAMSLLMGLQGGMMDLSASSTQINSGSGDQFVWSNVVDPPYQNGPVFRPIESESRVSSADYLTF